MTTLSVTPVLSWPRLGARLSNSSKNTMQGRAAWALRNRSRTLASLAPIYLDSSSGPRTEMRLRPVCEDTASARRVFPVPGGP